MSNTLKDIQRELQTKTDPGYKKAQERYFKEGITLYGVRLGVVRRIARKYFRQIKQRDKQEVFDLCEQLLKDGKQETLVIAFQWAWHMKRQFQQDDFSIFEQWLKTYVSNWAACDDLSTGPLGELLVAYPQLIRKTVPWRRSKNRWVRRASAVCLIWPAKSTKRLKDAFSAADALLTDKDDMVQKGFGWLLKEASNVYPNEVFAFVMKRKARMPRTALRYAIEKLPQRMRQRAMSQP